jgi:hypothetical protein
MSDDPTAALTLIRLRGYRNGATGAECARLSDAAAVDVPRLLAAVEAALKLADRLDSGRGDYGHLVNRHEAAAAFHAAITAALTGEEASDG